MGAQVEVVDPAPEAPLQLNATDAQPLAEQAAAPLVEPQADASPTEATETPQEPADPDFLQLTINKRLGPTDEMLQELLKFDETKEHIRQEVQRQAGTLGSLLPRVTATYNQANAALSKLIEDDSTGRIEEAVTKASATVANNTITRLLADPEFGESISEQDRQTPEYAAFFNTFNDVLNYGGSLDGVLKEWGKFQRELGRREGRTKGRERRELEYKEYFRLQGAQAQMQQLGAQAPKATNGGSPPPNEADGLRQKIQRGEMLTTAEAHRANQLGVFDLNQAIRTKPKG